MKRIHIMAAVLTAACALTIHAETYDQEGMPAVYLRGDFNQTGWQTSEAYRFSREGNRYTLEITAANPLEPGSQFKIASEEWIAVDLGGAQENIAITRTQNIQLARTGHNLTAPDGITEGSITFTYVEGAQKSVASVYIAGTEPLPGPEPGEPSGLSGTLPVLYINVYYDEAHTLYDNEVISPDLSHKNYFENAEYWLETNGCQWLEDLGAEDIGSKDKPLALQIKARGNWTRIGFAKKPYKLKLDKKQSLLGLSKSKHFALLAHADDNKGYLRNFTGFNLGKRIGLPWTPWQQPVEVVINGDYRGLYFLTESIRVDEERVNITELADNEQESRLVSGGYIVELDNYDEDDTAQIRMEERSCAPNQWLDLLRVTFDTPEQYSDLQRLFITQQFEAMNDFVGLNDDRLWTYLDLDDAARYYLVEEIVSHTEAYHGSTYLFRDYGDGRKWHFSPLWDFGNAFNGYTDSFFYDCDPFGNTWITSMRENAKFNAKVRETWLWFMSSEIDGLEADIDEYAGRITAAAAADHERWKAVAPPSGGQSVADNRDMKGRAAEVKAHLAAKTEWLKGVFGDYTKGSYAEPERDDTPAAPLPEYVATEVGGITEVGDGEAEILYNLQGLRETHPEPGNIYIVKRGGKVAKELVR